jgi:O2-independent ubiquinone biosynthesis accessory factor UbiT
MHKNMNAYTLPPPLGRLLSMLPVYPGSMLFSHALNLSLSALLRDDLRVLLRDKKMCISVTDAQLAFHFSWNGERFVGCSADASSDLKISAAAQDFLRLGTRQEDPDTLFFNRRLVMEGDTELGLAVKNMLDSMETPILRHEWLTPAAVAKSIRTRLAQERGGVRTANQ